MNKRNDNPVEKLSDYQKDCFFFYKGLREHYSNIFLTDERIAAEKNLHRYSNGSAGGIHNLNTFITALVQQLSRGEKVAGIDFGCGAHYFIDEIYRNYGWNVFGYDADRNAIAIAKKRYPQSARRYICRNLFLEKIPKKASSQDFIYSNSVFQHFSYDEIKEIFGDISKVLKKGGIFLAIFKANVSDWGQFQSEAEYDIDVLDSAEGKVEVTDRIIRRGIEKLSKGVREAIPDRLALGIRLLHFCSVDKIIEIAAQTGLQVMDNVMISGSPSTRGIFQYNSGRGLPTAVFFTKDE